MSEMEFDQEKADAALRRIRLGEAPSAFCGSHSSYPPDASVLEQWALDNTEFAGEYTKAKLTGADVMVAHCLVIADDMSKKADAKKLMIDTRMKLASLWNPEKYGPKATEKPNTPQAHVLIPFTQLPPDKKLELEKEFGL